MSIDREYALSLAASYLSERGIGGLIPGTPRIVLSGDPMSPQPDRDLWIVVFSRPPQPLGSEWISGGLVMVTVDKDTLELHRY